MREMRSAKSYAIFLVSVVLVGIFSISPAISSLPPTVIRSTGQILLPSANVTAESGSARDIQAAVDLVVAHGGIGNVYIPEGTFNFVNVDEDMPANGGRVVIPAGVNLFGAPTERDANDQVIEWKTILRIPWDVPGGWDVGKYWFYINGAGDPTRPTRVSDIKMVGYRSIDPLSEAVQGGFRINDVVNFRIDHIYQEHVCLGNPVLGWSTGKVCGVFDHCFFVNPVGKIGAYLSDCTVFYGIDINRVYGDVWDDDVTNVLGKYNDYTVFIEDCYFEKWRHCIGANTGAHYVIRHSTIKDDFGFGSIDSHGWGVWDGTKVTQVGTRATEIYENQILDAINMPWACAIRGGAGVAFNNTVGGGTYNVFLDLDNEADPEVSKCWIWDWYIWNNNLLSGMSLVGPSPGVEENQNYFLHAPTTFEYTPYPYPHPLTLET